MLKEKTTTSSAAVPITDWASLVTARAAVAAALLCLLMTAAAAGLAPQAKAAFGIVPGSFDGGTFNQDGSAFTQAGGHPYEASTSFGFNKVVSPFDICGGPCFIPDGAVKDIAVELPPGLVGDPNAAPRCPAFADVVALTCPPDTQVGMARVVLTSGDFQARVYNLDPPPGVPAAFGFNAGSVPVLLTAELRSDGDYGVTIHSKDSSQAGPLLATGVTFWGVPADPSHDAQRFGPGCTSGCPASVQPKPFLTNPTSCTPPGVGLETKLSVSPWDPARASDEATFTSHLPPGVPLPRDQWGPPQGPTGCDSVPFDPEVSIQPTSRAADAPTGLEVELTTPQNQNPVGLAQAHLKQTKVTLPEGMTISPSGAGGLAACSDSQLKQGSRQPAACPQASKIGTVRVDTPLLDQPLEGAIHIRSQNSSDPTSGEMFRLAIVLHSERYGIDVKLPGQVRANPETGRLETTFDNNPQLPFETFKLRFKGGPRAPLANPPTCGTKAVESEFTSWARPDEVVRLSDTFTIDCPGMAGFSPGLSAGLVAPLAGAFSPFVLELNRPDGQEYLDGLRVDLPPGLLAKVKGVPLCAGVLANAGTCPVGSRIGTVTVGAGPGSNPFFLSGSLFLTEGYKGGPYGLSIVVSVVAGPFDLGTVVVRQAVLVDRVTAEVAAVSDPIPTIVKGVPARLRTVHVSVDRRNFTLAPTSCSVKQVRATAHSQQGSSAQLASRFQASECASLPFKPKLALSLTGRRQVTTGKHPGVKAVVTQVGTSEARIKKAVVRLPKSLALDPDNAQALCEFVDGTKPDLENHCPKGSIVGRARAVTPLLGKPLAGNVYFVKNVRRSKAGNLIRTLPMIVVALRGQIAINLKGASSTTSNGQLVNTFAGVPDAPITRFNLNIEGGRGGILTVTRTRNARIDLCAKPKSHVADVDMDGHNGKRFDRDIRIKTPCAKKKK